MKANARFINTEKIEGYVYSTGSNFNQLSERVTGENSKNPGTKYMCWLVSMIYIPLQQMKMV